MKTKGLSVQVVMVTVCAIGLLALGLWLWSSPPSSTADVLRFYSPIPPIGDPQLSLTKTIDTDNPAAGDEVVYTLTYANTNSGSQAFNVRLYEFLPAGFAFLSSNPVADAVQDGVVVFTAPSIGPSTNSMRVDIRGRVQAGYERLYNHALVLADGVTPAHASLWTDVTQLSSSLRLTKSGYSAVLTNGELVYTLMVQNTGDKQANDVMLVDVLPTGLPLIGASPPPDEEMLPVLKWSLGNIGPGERRTVVVTTTAPDSVGMITNTGLADSRQGVITQTVFSTQVVDQAAILRVEKQGSTPTVFVDGELVYTIEYENAGNQAATGVRLVDLFPAGIDIVSAVPPASSSAGQQRIWQLGTLNPGEAGQIVVTTVVRGKPGRTLRNVADITGQAGSLPGHAELETDVRFQQLYLPLIKKHSP